jgi:hypothetical protein
MPKLQTPRRCRTVKWRVTDAEYRYLHETALTLNISISDLIRRSVNAQPVRRRSLRPIGNPGLVRALVRIAVILNQIAQWANSQLSANAAADVIQQLVIIERVLKDVTAHAA